MEPLHYPTRRTGYGTAGAHEESECRRGDLCGGGGDECIRCKDLSSRLSRTTRKLLGWTRRVGIGAAASGRMLCPNRANALEKAICGFAENPGDNLIVSKLVQALICLPQSGQGITGNGR